MEDNLKDLNIGVFRGGVSGERDISLISGQKVFTVLKEAGYKVIDIDLKTTDAKEILYLLKKNSIDIVFIVLHGEFGEDGQIQKIFEENNVRFTGSDSLSSYLAMDKIQSYRIFEKNGIRCPEFRVWGKDNLELSAGDFPLVIKPHYGGSTLGISIIKDESQLKESVSKAKEVSDQVLIEKYIAGREFTVGILNDKVLPVIEIKFKAELFDYSSKYDDHNLAEVTVPADLPAAVYKDVQDLSLKVYQVLGSKGAARVDLKTDNDYNPYILELNSVPGLTGHSLLPLACKQAGIDFVRMCEEILLSALKEAG